MKSFIRFAVLTLALISAGQASAVFAADAWEIVTPTGTSGYSFTSISTMDNYVYLGTNHGVYRSTNRGTAWSQINSGLANQSVRAIAIGTIFDGSAYAITSNSPVFAATAGGVFKSTIGNTTWSSANVGLTDTNIKDIQFDQFLATQGIDTTVYVATPAGVFRSDDAGDNWLLVDTGMTGQSVTKIMTDFVTGNIYAVTSANEVYVSPMFSASGADESWTLAYSGSAIRDISLLNPLGAISWLAADGGILKSDENGINWFTVNSGNTSGRVNVIMSDYLDMNVTYAGSQTGGVYRTINEALGAPAWSQISTSLSDTAISDIATNPATSLVVYAAGANGVYRLELSDAYADISTTPVVATDTTLPTVSISAPANNATVSGNTTISATAGDNVAVVGVQFKLDGANLVAEDTSSPYSFSWNTASTSNGSHTLTAVARDAAGNTQTATTVTVDVNNVVVVPDITLPTVSAFTVPATATSLTVAGISITASDNIAVTGYLITESSAKPAAGSGNWTVSAPTSYTFASAGAKTVYAWAKDAAGNVSNAFTARNVTITLPDTTLPTLTAFTMPTTATSTIVPVNTLTASDNVAVTGYLITESSTKPTSGAAGWSSIKPTTFTFTGTGARTAYAWAKDAAGNVSNVYTVRNVTITLPDTTIPTVSISTPTNNSTVSGNTNVSATASDNVGVAGVQFKLDGANLGAEDTSSPYSTVWNTASNTNGSYTLTAVARDASGNTATASTININVNNVVVVPDTTAPTAPTNFSVTPVASNQINLSWTASTDAVGVTGYRVMRKNGSGAFALIATTAMTTYQNTGLSPLSNYTYVIAAYDAVGNVSASSTAVSATTLATPDITNPTVNLTAPANNATVSDTVLVAANASDNVGVIGVQFKLDGANLGAEDTTAPYSFSWNTASTSNGSHTLTAVARDAASNTQTATVVNVVVSNVVITTPTAPANLSASVVSTSQINLTWTASIEAIASYEIYRDNNLVAVVAHPTTSFADTGLAAGATYTYTAKTVTATGVKSVFSNSVSAKTQSKASSGGGGGGGGGSSSTRGCTDPKATNYSAKAKKDNGTCKYAIVKSPTAGSSVVVNNPTSVSGYTFTVVMGLGSKGNDVMELQKVLVSLGYLSETPTGYYGVMTEQAVKKFQIAKGLDAVGSVGPQTRTALNQITAKGSGVKTNDQIIQEKITQLLLLVQELTKKLLILKAAEGR